MAEIRETHIERDADGNVVDTKVVERRRGGGGFGWGMIFGVAVLAVAVIAFAYSQGSFQQAGVEADQVAAQVEQQADSAVDGAQQALNETSDTATN